MRAIASAVSRLLGHPQLRRRLLLAGAVGLAVWIGFLDSHSVWRRVAYAREHRALVAENEALRAEAAELEALLAAPVSDATVERIAREEYGMRRAGETVYRVLPEDAE